MTDKNKLHKFTVYIYGINDNVECSISEASEIISSTKWDYIIHPYHEKTIIIDRINDNHPLNRNNLPKEFWEKYMDDKLKEFYVNKLKADEELEEYKKTIGV